MNTAINTLCSNDTAIVGTDSKIVNLEDRVQRLEDMLDWIMANIQYDNKIDFEELMNK